MTADSSPKLSPMLRLIPAREYRRERWRNDLGWTREIVREPEVGDWSWRLSIAEIEQDAAFSEFPGVERELVLLHGNGLRLRFGDGETVALDPPHGRCRFAGERAVRGELVDGPTHDFNLMWRRDRIDAQLWHRPLVGSMVVFVEPDECWGAFLLGGRASCSDGERAVALGAHDTVLMRADGGRRRYLLEGGGELLLMRLREIDREAVATPDAA